MLVESAAAHDISQIFREKDLVLCVAAAADEASVAQFQSLASASKKGISFMLVLCGNDDASEARARFLQDGHGTLHTHVVASAQDRTLVKFVFNATVAHILEANLRASGFPKTRGGW